jgi:16S rRNA (cytidine1402-2'-O)-methyltransferase
MASRLGAPGARLHSRRGRADESLSPEHDAVAEDSAGRVNGSRADAAGEKVWARQESSGLTPGTLYIVGTPIGNLEDITLRALRVLREADVVAAEDTRHTRALLTHYGINRPLVSYREQNRASSAPLLLARLDTGSVALVSDAGMPAIADPGAALIADVIARGGRVEVVPGPNAALAALVCSGLPPAPFLFAGFLSRQRGDRRRQLQALATRPETLVFYEAPHRVVETLTDLLAVLGDRPAAACRELTKLHEEVRRAPLSVLLERFTATAPRGEFVLVVEGGGRGVNPAASEGTLSDDDVDRLLMEAMERGERMRVVVADLAARSGHSRRDVYARWQALRHDEEALTPTPWLTGPSAAADGPAHSH